VLQELFFLLRVDGPTILFGMGLDKGIVFLIPTSTSANAGLGVGRHGSGRSVNLSRFLPDAFVESYISEFG
jgi:hypothetical protein